MRRRISVAAPLAVSLYILWPAPGWGLLEGVPLGPIAALALCAVWLVWLAGGRLPAWPIAIAVLLAIKIGGSALISERGLTARYFANDRAQTPVERSLDFRARPYTRIDRTLIFGPRESRDLPLFFFNDFLRFNFYRPDEPDRRLLPYSVEWTGHLLVDEDERVEMFLGADGADGRIVVDAAPAVTLARDQGMARSTIALGRGWHQLVITIQAPPGGGRSLVYAGLIDRTGVDRPFDDRDVYPRRLSDRQAAVDGVMRRVSLGIDGVVLTALAFGVLTVVVAACRPWRPASFAVVAYIAAVAEACRYALPWNSRVMPLGGGSDMLTYETYARDIVFHGPLMTLGHPVGSATPFYYQPLYPYVLAALHAIFGEGYFGIVFAQRLLVAVTVALVWRITDVLFGRRAGAAAALAGGAALYVRFGPWAAVLLGEIVFVPLVCAWTLLSIELADGRPRAWWRAGLAGGLATLSRSTLLLAWVPVSALVALTTRRAGRRLPATLLASLAVMVAVVSLATARNWIASRTFVPIATSFGINFRLGNEPPAGLGVPVHSAGQHRFYDWFAADDSIRIPIEFARHAPLAFTRNLANKALYTLGFFAAYVDGGGWSPLLVSLWVSALAGAIVLWTGRASGGPPLPVQAIPGVIAACHFAAVTMIFPHIYGDRLILPFYALILPYSALALATVVDRVVRP